MGAIKALFMDLQDEMNAVAKELEFATEDGDLDLMFDTLIECTAKLAVITRRYHGVHSR